ncbi:MAG: Rrf2 family transcriptional regulator [Phascolarctobacterium sp.]|nr:Rrf2 family transcriptional regulator [Phascolarctobacterium sp.]
MRVSTKGRYCLRIMVYLAENYIVGYKSVKDIAKEEDLSLKYVERLMQILSKSKLVISEHGPNGGYKLAISPSECSVAMVIKAAETQESIAPCCDANNTCPRYDRCATAEVWQLVQTSIDELLENITLIDLLKSLENKRGEKSLYLSYLNALKQ